jgi:hypothetical protein
MNITKMLEAISKYLTEGFARIFSHQEDEVPEIGVQPFECAPYSKESEAK